jgi:hypothetical protein
MQSWLKKTSFIFKREGYEHCKAQKARLGGAGTHL